MSTIELKEQDLIQEKEDRLEKQLKENKELFNTFMIRNSFENIRYNNF